MNDETPGPDAKAGLTGLDARFPAQASNPVFRRNANMVGPCGIDSDGDAQTWEKMVQVPEGTLMAYLGCPKPDKRFLVPCRWADGTVVFIPLHALDYVSGEFGEKLDDDRETYEV